MSPQVSPDAECTLLLEVDSEPFDYSLLDTTPAFSSLNLNLNHILVHHISDICLSVRDYSLLDHSHDEEPELMHPAGTLHLVFRYGSALRPAIQFSHITKYEI